MPQQSQCRRDRTQPRSSAARGFTLIELLVAMTILLILATLTIRLVNTTLDSDRIKGGSRELQSYLAGARDRAAYAGQPRGVRFIPDPNDPYTIRSFVYIGAPTNFTDGQLITVASGSTTIIPTAATISTWSGMINRGLLLPGAQITLGGSAAGGGAYNSIAPNPVSTAPAWAATTGYGLGAIVQPGTANGHTYVCTTAGTSGGATPTWPTGTGATVNDNSVVWTEFSWTLTKNYTGAATSVAYTLQLAPAQLPNEQPRTLPRNTVIDLRTSIIPGNWQLPPTASSTFDVLFSPSGSVVGPDVASGRIHLVFSDIAETSGEVATTVLSTPALQRFQLNAPWLANQAYSTGNVIVPTPATLVAFRCLTAGTSGGTQPTWPSQTNVTVSDGGVTWQSFLKKPNLIMSLATATGQVATHPVNVSPTPPLTVTTPTITVTGYDSFLFAETGEVAP